LVTFAVHEWFRGGAGESVTITMGVRGHDPDSALTFDNGTRLLVSGEPRRGGKPMDDPLATIACGFTRPYDATTAAAWRSVLEK
jgi:hypothetical protein